MTRWEYLAEVMPQEITADPDAVMAWLNKRGEWGWELVNTPSNCWFTFKRQKAHVLRPINEDKIVTDWK